jgi:hypothetical protein
MRRFVGDALFERGAEGDHAAGAVRLQSLYLNNVTLIDYYRDSAATSW